MEKIAPKLLTILATAAMLIGIAPSLHADTFTGPIYLNFQEDPRHNMVVSYHYDEDQPPLDVHYRQRGAETWQLQAPVGRDFQNEPTVIYHAALSGLQALTEYEFKIGEQGEVFWFLTMPDDLSRPVVGAFGADFQEGPARWVQMVQLVVQNDVDFFVVAGDWVNDDGNLQRSGRWVNFWNLIWREMVNAEGRMIPFVAGVGNHECKHNVNMERFFFTDMFAFPDEGPHEFYGVIDFGDYLSLVALDSEMDSRENQNQWLQGVLAERTGIQYIVPYYHRPIFPSHRGHYTTRLDWFHTFYEAGIRATFTGHDHAYKRTHPVVSDPEQSNGVRLADANEKGLVEFGDGGLGTKFYSADLRNAWYMADTRTNINHFTVVVFEPHQMQLTTLDGAGDLIYETEIGVATFFLNDSPRQQTLPQNSITLNATVESRAYQSDELSYQWELIEAPGAASIKYTDTLDPVIVMSAPGTYLVQARAFSPDPSTMVAEQTFSFELKSPQGEPTVKAATLTDDAHTHRGSGDTNFGAEESVMVKSLASSSNAREGFFKFTLPSTEDIEVLGAQLRLYRTGDSTPHSSELSLLENTTWTEDTLTWNNRPEVGTLLASWSDDGTAGWVELDLDPAALSSIFTDGVASFRLSVTSQEDSNPNTRYASKDGANEANRAQLLITGQEIQSYQDWLVQEDIPESEQSFDLDRFGRGITNLMAYFTGLSAESPEFPITLMEDSTWHISLPWKNTLPPSAFFVIEQSTDLTSWSPLEWNEWQTSTIDDNRKLHEASISFEAMDQDQAAARFLRLRMEK